MERIPPARPRSDGLSIRRGRIWAMSWASVGSILDVDSGNRTSRCVLYIRRGEAFYLPRPLTLWSHQAPAILNPSLERKYDGALYVDQVRSRSWLGCLGPCPRGRVCCHRLTSVTLSHTKDRQSLAESLSDSQRKQLSGRWDLCCVYLTMRALQGTLGMNKRP